MANGDPLLVGVTQPPDNRATSATMLVHNGSAFGTQSTAFWVQRVGQPVANAAIRGDNFSTGASAGQTHAGVFGMIRATSAGVGVMGTASGQPNLFFGETGVMGVTNSFGVIGRALTGVIEQGPGLLVSATGVVGECSAGIGVRGTATSGWGVIGESASRAGVTGTSNSGAGVEARSAQSHALIAAAPNGVGVLADSDAGSGVLGRSAAGVGVYGYSDQGLAGVVGESPRLYGVRGISEQGVGVAGVSQHNAIQGRSTGSGPASVGVAGSSDAGQGVFGDSTRGIAIGGRSAQGWAGYFEGNVAVRGGFYVVGGPKAAVVPHPDGTQRTLFSLESPESYFEDFGEVALTGASILVKLDKDFAALVKRDKYQVFLTSYGPEALYVRKRSADGFEIARLERDTGSKPRSIRVGYRVVAHRADVRRERLPKMRTPAAAAKIARLDLPTGKARRKRADAVLPRVKLDRLPGPPKTPAVDLQALAAAEPGDT